MDIKKVLKNITFKNAGWMIGERVFQMAISLFVGVLTARYLGPANFGIINYVASFVGFATPICNLGLESIIIKRLIENPKDEGRILGSSIWMRFWVSVISAILIVYVVGKTNGDSQLYYTVAALESVALLFRSAEVIEYWYQSRLQSKTSSIVKMIAYTCMSAYRVILLLNGMTVEWFAVAMSLDALIIGVLYLLLYTRDSSHPLTWDSSCASKLLKDSYHFILSGVLVVMYTQMDKIMIKYIIDSEEGVGLYSAASTVASLWFFVPTALINAARPTIMKDYERDYPNYLKRIRQLYAIIIWLGIFVGIGFSVLDNKIISVLYGDNYLEASGTLNKLIWYGLFAQIGTARSIWITCEGKQKYVKYYVAWGALLNFLLNIILIPSYGIAGAAVATLSSQFFVAIVAPMFYKSTRIHTRYVIEGFLLKFEDKKEAL